MVLKNWLVLAAILFLTLAGCEQNQAGGTVQSLVSSPTFQDGDIIFQTSQSDQSKAIQAATGSKYSHCGILYRDGDRIQVYEAVGPVKLTPIDEWINRGEGKKFVVKRLINAGQLLTPSAIQQMKSVGRKFLGKPYDLVFEWSDEKIYCSELVWKIYQEGIGVSVGNIEHLKDFELNHPVVRQKLLERYGSKIPLEEEVVSPASIFDSALLETVFSN